MLIERDGLDGFVEERLFEFAQSMPVTETKCPHCCLPVRRPIIARQTDIDDFKRLMKSAFKAMDEFGITGNLLAAITANCHIEIAKRKAKENKGE